MRLGGHLASRRTLLLMGTLLVLLAGYLTAQFGLMRLQWFEARPPDMRAITARMATGNSISGFEVKQSASGTWTAEFNCTYTGSPPGPW